MNQTLETIFARHSVRAYRADAPATAEEMELLLEAAMAAPCACNCRPWEFIVIDTPEMVEACAAIHPYATYIRAAQRGIIVCGDRSQAFQEIPDYWVQDCSAATENILLAAKSLGLDTVWCGIHPNPLLEPEFRKLFRLPESVIPLNLIVIGHAEKESAPQQKFNPKKIHRNCW